MVISLAPKCQGAATAAKPSRSADLGEDPRWGRWHQLLVALKRPTSDSGSDTEVARPDRDPPTDEVRLLLDRARKRALPSNLSGDAGSLDEPAESASPYASRDD